VAKDESSVSADSPKEHFGIGEVVRLPRSAVSPTSWLFLVLAVQPFAMALVELPNSILWDVHCHWNIFGIHSPCLSVMETT
jgi:hypothetical protein